VRIRRRTDEQAAGERADADRRDAEEGERLASGSM
jgi:hypothetical protein